MSATSAPVFIVGCPRSGTTWLYHLVLSAGEFANYRAETHFFDLFIPRYGSPERPASRRALADAWLGSSYHVRTGLDAEALRPRLLGRGTTPGAFLREIMDATASAQGLTRWADATPAHALHVARIAAELPEARFVHLVRDGRDVALSLAPRGWVRTLPWDRGDELLVAAWRWERIVTRARRAGTALDGRMIEVRYEDLVTDTAATLARVGSHIGAALDLETIRRNPVGSVARPNTSFDRGGSFRPVGRWRECCSPTELAALEGTIGDTLTDFGYRLGGAPARSTGLRARRAAYRAWADARDLVRERTAWGRRRIDPAAAAPPADEPDDEAGV